MSNNNMIYSFRAKYYRNNSVIRNQTRVTENLREVSEEIRGSITNALREASQVIKSRRIDSSPCG
jgi:hypothetical protein